MADVGSDVTERRLVGATRCDLVRHSLMTRPPEAAWMCAGVDCLQLDGWPVEGSQEERKLQWSCYGGLAIKLVDVPARYLRRQRDVYDPDR